MPKRSSRPKRDEDTNETAFRVVRAATGEKLEKNPAAVALGRLGGLKGGKARAAKLSKKRLSEIGKAGAAKRWKAKGAPKRPPSSKAD